MEKSQISNRGRVSADLDEVYSPKIKNRNIPNEKGLKSSTNSISTLD